MDEERVEVRPGGSGSATAPPATACAASRGHTDGVDLTVELDRLRPRPRADLHDPAVRLQVERSLTSVPGVLGARLLPATGDTIEELHVLTVVDRSPSRTARDVRTVLMARFGVPTDRRAIRVVPLDQRQVDRDRPVPGRAVIERVALADGDGATTVEVTLRDREGLHAATSAVGERHADPSRAVADATLGAVAQLAGGRTDLALEGVETVEVAGNPLAVVVLRAHTMRSGALLSGTALVRSTLEDAVARAVMDAINRAMAIGPTTTA